MVRLGKVYGNLMVDVQVKNAKLERRARGMVMEITGLEEERAGQLLARAGYEVKTAVVMALLGVSVEEARERLAGSGGVLRKVIGR